MTRLLFRSAAPLDSAIGVAWLQVRQVEDLQAEVIEVAVAVGLLDEPPDLVVEPLGLGVRRASELPESEHALEVSLYGLRHLLDVKLADAPPHVGRDPRHRLAPDAADASRRP